MTYVKGNAACAIVRGASDSAGDSIHDASAPISQEQTKPGPRKYTQKAARFQDAYRGDRLRDGPELRDGRLGALNDDRPELDGAL